MTRRFVAGLALAVAGLCSNAHAQTNSRDLVLASLEDLMNIEITSAGRKEQRADDVAARPEPQSGERGLEIARRALTPFGGGPAALHLGRGERGHMARQLLGGGRRRRRAGQMGAEKQDQREGRSGEGGRAPHGSQLYCLP